LLQEEDITKVGKKKKKKGFIFKFGLMWLSFIFFFFQFV